MEKVKIQFSPLQIILSNNTSSLVPADFFQNAAFHSPPNNYALTNGNSKTFYITYHNPHIKDLSSITAHIAIDDPTQSDKVLESFDISLTRDPATGLFQSQPLLPVPLAKWDELTLIDETQLAQGLAPSDNSSADRSVHVKMGSTITVSLTLTDPSNGQNLTVETSTQVTPQTILPIERVILVDEKGNPVTTPQEMEEAMAAIEAAAALQGCKVVYTGEPKTLALPAGVNLSDGLEESETKLLAQSAQNFSSKKPVLKIIFTGDSTQKSDAFQISGGPDKMGRDIANPLYHDTLFIKGGKLEFYGLKPSIDRFIGDDKLRIGANDTVILQHPNSQNLNSHTKSRSTKIFDTASKRSPQPTPVIIP